MALLDTNRFARLRELLAEPRRDLEALRSLIREWPESGGREEAIAYLKQHFSEGQPTPPSAFLSPEEFRMLFDPETNELFTNKGLFIKKLECPLTKRWQQLEKVDDKDFKRLCQDCNKHVVNTEGLNDEQVYAIVQYDESVCLHISEEFGNVEFVKPLPVDQRTGEEMPYPYHRVTPGIRVIKTARTQNAINRAVEQGFRPVVKGAQLDGRINSFRQVVQHEDTGRVEVIGDLRSSYFGGRDGVKVIHDVGDYNPTYHFPSAFAAYLVPEDIEVGERVFLEDLIENFIDGYHQGAYRLQGVEAIWNGDDFDILYDEENDVYHAIG